MTGDLLPPGQRLASEPPRNPGSFTNTVLGRHLDPERSLPRSSRRRLSLLRCGRQRRSPQRLDPTGGKRQTGGYGVSSDDAPVGGRDRSGRVLRRSSPRRRSRYAARRLARRAGLRDLRSARIGTARARLVRTPMGECPPSQRRMRVRTRSETTTVRRHRAAFAIVDPFVDAAEDLLVPGSSLGEIHPARLPVRRPRYAS